MNTKKEYNEQMIRWLEGELQGKELSEFEASSEFQEYKKIIDATDELNYPKMDESAVFDTIQNRITNNRKKTN